MDEMKTDDIISHWGKWGAEFVCVRGRGWEGFLPGSGVLGIV